MNGWIAEFPESDGQEIIARFKSGNSLQYQAALAAVTVHAALKRQDYDMRLRPTCSHPTRRPDFEVAERGCGRGGDTFNPAADEVAQGQRDAAVYNALDKVKLPPGWRIGLDIIKHGVRELE